MCHLNLFNILVICEEVRCFDLGDIPSQEGNEVRGQFPHKGITLVQKTGEAIAD